MGTALAQDSVRVEVRDAETYRTLPGVLVKLNETGAEALSDSTGHCLLPHPGTRRFTLSGSRDGFLSASSRYAPRDSTKPWVLLQLYASGTRTVCGVVTDIRTADSLRDVRVTVRGTNLFTRTDSDGRFVLTGLVLGRQVLVASEPEHHPESLEVAVSAGEAVDVDFALQDTWPAAYGSLGYLNVEVRDAESQVLLPGAVVSVGRRRHCATGPSGVCRLRVPVPCRCTVRVRKQGYGPATVGWRVGPRESTWAFVRLHALPACVRGRVIDLTTGRPLAGVTVTTIQESLSAVTDRDGQFLISSNRSTRVDLEAALPGFSAWEASAPPTAGETASVLIRMYDQSKYGRIAGKVLDAKTGKPLAGASVVLQGAELGAATDEQGEYLIFNVPPGKWRLAASFIGYQDGRAKSVRVRPSETTVQDFRLKPVEYGFGTPAPGPRPPPLAQLFELVRVGLGPVSATFGERTGLARGFLSRSGRAELGAVAAGYEVKKGPCVMAGFKLVEFYDEGGTRDGQPAFLPVYLYVFGRLRLVRGYIEPTVTERASYSWGLLTPTVYGYVTGSVSRSVGAGVGVQTPWYWVPPCVRLRFAPGIELNVFRSWNGTVSFTRASLHLSLGLGAWSVRRLVYI